jgi:MFS transporter, PAT family, beta-lactamase induction signal transducer AmpG
MKSLSRVFTSRKMTIIFLLGFSSGLPLLLTKDTFKVWLASELGSENVHLVGLASLVGIPYAWKFLWSPVMDRYIPPFGGRRRGWILISQSALIIAISAMAFGNPNIASRTSLIVLGFLALLVAFSSASQDIVVDAYRTEILSREEFGAGAGYSIIGYRIGMLVSGSLALILAGQMAYIIGNRFSWNPEYASNLSWRLVYLLMAATMLIGIIATLLAPEPQVDAKPPQTFSEAVILPFTEFLSRKGAFEILLFILIYKLGTTLAIMMAPSFIVALGFTKEEIGTIYGGLGIMASILGYLIGGAIMLRIRLRDALWAFGILQGASIFLLFFLAQVGHNRLMMIISILGLYLFVGMATVAYAAFLMSLCNVRFTATQYALFTSLMALNVIIIGSLSGFLAKSLGVGDNPLVSKVGWERYFLICVLCTIPALLMLLRYKAWRTTEERKDSGIGEERT